MNLNLKKRPIFYKVRNVEIGHSSMALHTMSWTLIVISHSNHLRVNVFTILLKNLFLIDILLYEVGKSEVQGHSKIKKLGFYRFFAFLIHFDLHMTLIFYLYISYVFLKFDFIPK